MNLCDLKAEACVCVLFYEPGIPILRVDGPRSYKDFTVNDILGNFYCTAAERMYNFIKEENPSFFRVLSFYCELTISADVYYASYTLVTYLPPSRCIKILAPLEVWNFVQHNR